MRIRPLLRHFLTAGLLCVAGGCNVVPVGFADPAAKTDALRAFRAGQAEMQCGRGLECAVYWSEARPAASRLVLAERWEDVADVVLRAGYEQDLTWFYLGLAAEGVGQPQAARTYYDNAVRRSLYGSGQSCRATGMGHCDGIRLPEDAQKLHAGIAARGRGAARAAGLSPTARSFVQDLARFRADQASPRSASPAGTTQPARLADATQPTCPANYRC